MSPPQIHLFKKSDYATHTLLTLPSTSDTPLAPSSIRLRTKIIGLTTNNLTYARMGHILGWWGIYAPPADLPAPYSSPDAHSASEYTTVPAWGYAEILASTVPSITPGSSVYGYIPTSTLPYDVSVTSTPFANQFFVTDPERQALWAIYNRLQLHPALPSVIASRKLGKESLGYDALMQALFGTGFNLNRYAFSWGKDGDGDDSASPARIHPSGTASWTQADADLHNATVILLSASGKTAMSFAWCLRHDRPREVRPRALLAVCSEASRAVCEGSGFYDKTVLYGDVEAGRRILLGEGEEPEPEQKKAKRVVLLDFGARGSSKEAWTDLLSTLDASIPYTVISVGAEVKPQTPEQTLELLKARMGAGSVTVNANVLREKGIETEGDVYFERFYNTFERFKQEGGVPGLRLDWGEGMGAWEEGWEAFCGDQVAADRGLVYWV